MKEVGRIKGVKPKVWKQLKAVEGRVSKIEKIPFIRWLLKWSK